MTQHPTKEEIAELVEFVIGRLIYVSRQRNIMTPRSKSAKAIVADFEPMREALETRNEDYARAEEKLRNTFADFNSMRTRAEAAEAERDALRERVKELRGALSNLLSTDEAKNKLRSLDNGIGTRTKNAVWMNARAALAKDDK